MSCVIHQANAPSGKYSSATSFRVWQRQSFGSLTTQMLCSPTWLTLTSTCPVPQNHRQLGSFSLRPPGWDKQSWQTTPLWDGDRVGLRRCGKEKERANIWPLTLYSHKVKSRKRISYSELFERTQSLANGSKSEQAAREWYVSLYNSYNMNKANKLIFLKAMGFS